MSLAPLLLALVCAPLLPAAQVGSYFPPVSGDGSAHGGTLDLDDLDDLLGTADDDPAGSGPAAADAPPPLPTTQPGAGPTLAFDPDRWEWWFDFHQEGLLALRPRLQALPPGPDGAPAWVAPDLTDRLERVLPVLEEAARAPQRDLRATAALALGRLGEPAALPALLELADDRNLFVRAQALLGLGASGCPEALPRLAVGLDERRTPAVLFTYAAAAAGLHGSDGALELLAPRVEPRRLARTSQQERAALIHAAGLAGRAELDARLLGLRKEWLWQHDADVRALVAVALGRSGRAANVDPVLDLLLDDDNQVRRSAASALSGLVHALDPPRVDFLLRQHAGEGDVSIRLHLLMVFGRVRTDAARERLIAVLERRSAGLERPFAALALGLDGHPESVDALLAQLEGESVRSVRGAYAVALGLAGDPRGVAPLRAWLADATEPALQGWLALGLGLLGDDDGAVRARLERLLDRSHDPETLRLASLGLALLGRGAELRARLAELSSLRSTVDRAALLFGHGEVGDARSLPRLVELATDDEQPIYLRRYALSALGQICEPRQPSFPWELSRLAEPRHRVGFLFELTRVY